ncbi:MAG: DUF1824 family protein [Leptolyngbyaceae cyanobacterium SU_3_3]|nr:DUF1824 family protein [Leptolyngbyaceae cyanobacterium SU_3_3]NJR51938.1 DUF1824 family protein [Leptolyngbyaceae cyanobacterium CSU_1_3]
MSAQNPVILTQEEAQKILRQFICVDRTTPVSLDYGLIRSALLLVVNQSDYQIFGVCADSLEHGKQALYSYLSALGYVDLPDIAATIEGAVYIKHNPKTERSYAKPYTGADRGVLVSCQSAYDGDVNETFGHLPIDLFSRE